MSKSNFAVALIALGSLAALPACSMGSHYPQTSSAAPAPASQELSPGMVRQVQTALQQQNLYSGPIDGVWGPQTMSAVQNYQQSHSLSATGQLDNQTLASLNLPTNAATADNSTTQSQPAGSVQQSPDTVRQVQTALQQQGLYRGGIDGVWGPRTQSAVQSFQQSHSLTATGQLDNQTMAALNLNGTSAVPAAQSNAAPAPSNMSATAPTNYPPNTPAGPPTNATKAPASTTP